MRDAPQNCDDIGRVLFRLLNNDKALSRKYKTPVVSKNLLLEPESQPKRAEPRDQKTARRRRALAPTDLRARTSRQQSNDKRHGDRERRPVAEAKSGVQELQTAVFSAMNYPRSPKMILPDLVKRFLGMF